ncbi:MAG: HD domain-containing phosphohydrolase [Bacillota bacterium]
MEEVFPSQLIRKVLPHKMNLITVLYMFACFFALYLGIYLLKLNHKSAISRIFFLYCITGSFWALSYAFMQTAPDIETALLWRRISVPWWCLHYAFILHFFLVLTKQKKILKKNWIYPVIYAPGIILIALFLIPSGGVSKEYLFLTNWGWTYLLNPTDPVRFWGFTSYYLSYMLTTMGITVYWWGTTKFEREKKQAEIILIASIAAIGIGSIPDIVLPTLDIIKLPLLGIIANLFPLTAIWYVIKEYHFMALNTEKINKDIIETMQEGLLTCNVEGEIKMINESTTDILGYQERELINQPLNLIFSDEDSKKYFTAANLKQIEQNYIFKSEEKYLLTKDKNEIPCLFSASILHDDWGEVLGAVCTFQDITERKEAENNLTHLTFHDQLTGLYNRTYLEQQLNQINSTGEVEIALIMIDLNGLKLINDGFGHEAGDKMLTRTAEVLNKSCRNSDIVGRWGGDEFIIIMSGIDQAKLEEITKRIKEKCKETPKDPVPISLALGSSIKTEREEDIYETLKRAEDEMYNKKLFEHKIVQSDTLDTLLDNLGSKSHESEQHISRIQELACDLGEQINLSTVELEHLSLLASLHDIGKVTIAEEILNKPGSLTEIEWQNIKRHPEIGYRIASATDDFAHVAEEILYHHEWWDGSGYQEGLKGEEIPLLSRIIAIAEAYEVMTSGRPYQDAVTEKEALEELKEYAGSQFDPQLVEEFVELINTND